MKMQNRGKQKLACFEQEPAGAGRSFSFPLPFCSCPFFFLFFLFSFSHVLSLSRPLCVFSGFRSSSLCFCFLFAFSFSLFFSGFSSSVSASFLSFFFSEVSSCLCSSPSSMFFYSSLLFPPLSSVFSLVPPVLFCSSPGSLGLLSVPQSTSVCHSNIYVVA